MFDNIGSDISDLERVSREQQELLKRQEQLMKSEQRLAYKCYAYEQFFEAAKAVQPSWTDKMWEIFKAIVK
jgi:hypothetical protein